MTSRRRQLEILIISRSHKHAILLIRRKLFVSEALTLARGLTRGLIFIQAQNAPAWKEGYDARPQWRSRLHHRSPSQ